MIDSLRCVVLNSTYEPLCVVTAKKALVLYLEGKATVVETHPKYRIHSVRESFPIPVKIVLKRFVNRRITNAVLTRKNLFIRDNHTCQYCLRHKNDLHDREFLTRDHVIPQQTGGGNSWTNLVTSCNTCNNRKGNKRPEDAGLVLYKKPQVPTIVDLWMYKVNF